MASGKMSIPARPIQVAIAMSEGTTLQLSADMMKCRLISIWIGRYGYFGTAIIPTQKIREGVCGGATEGCILLTTGEAGWKIGINQTGLITLISKYGGVGDPNMEINGIN